MDGIVATSFALFTVYMLCRTVITILTACERIDCQIYKYFIFYSHSFHNHFQNNEYYFEKSQKRIIETASTGN